MIVIESLAQYGALTIKTATTVAYVFDFLWIVCRDLINKGSIVQWEIKKGALPLNSVAFLAQSEMRTVTNCVFLLSREHVFPVRALSCETTTLIGSLLTSE